VAEPLTYDRANRMQRALRRLGGTAGGSWLFARAMHRVDRPVFRASRGRHTMTSLLTGLPVVLLTTTGARSGRRRSAPVLGVPTGDGIAVIASNYGQSRHPAWYHNLRANPEAELSLNGRMLRVRARELEGEERDRTWRQGLRIYPGWATYERRTGGREIPVVLLEGAGAAGEPDA
jgi:deazaflavin-dependent oxidoreductase (nitroreductase family)